MSRAERPQYLTINVKPKGASFGHVSICGPTPVVSKINKNCSSYITTKFPGDVNFEQIGSASKLTIYGDCQLIKASFIEDVLGAGFKPSSGKGDSLRFSRNVRLYKSSKREQRC